MADTDNVLYAFLALILGGMILFAVYKTSSNGGKEKFQKQKKIKENMLTAAQTLRAERKVEALQSAIEKKIKEKDEVCNALAEQLEEIKAELAATQNSLDEARTETFNVKKSASKNLDNFKRQTETFKSTLAKCPGGNFENFSNKTTTIGKMKKEAFKKGKIPLRENYAGDNLGINTGANQTTSAELASNVARGGAVQITSAPQLGMELPSNARQPFRRRAGDRRMRR